MPDAMLPNSDDDDTLLARAASGDGVAFRVLVERHQGTLTRVAFRLLNGDRMAAEDAAQEAFVRLWRTAKTFEARGNLRAYLLRVTVNYCADLRRRRRDVADLDDCAEQAAKGPGLEADVHARMNAEAVRHAVTELPEAQRAVFVLSEYEGLSYREIAETLEIPVGTVGSRRHLAVEALRRRLRPLLEEGTEE